ncbi:maleylpyruvate isomerase N-terminal domain-containing protein [Streptomyces incarnatus]|nr:MULTISPECIES: maleylpyruvate isomerase N-terminal domain-containing protein [Streptomyces]
MIPNEVAEPLPELVPFVRAVQARRPDDGTWCEAWTVRDVLIHQTGNAEELARVLQAFLAGTPVETRGFDREAPTAACPTPTSGRPSCATART